jgi:acyl-coenzyme A thioesterase PaaI-like protein
MDENLQDRYAPDTRCFGCGPSNPDGLRIKTVMAGGEGICDFMPAEAHEAFEGYVAGGIIGVVFDCHCNWTAAHHLMVRNGLDRPPATVTAEYSVAFRAPTPSGRPLRFRARVVDASDRRATVEGELEADGVVTATCRGVFVAVGEGHPAAARW